MSVSEPYHLAVLSRPDLGFVRAPGPGFGNLLFPIARSVIGQAEHGGTLVASTMRQIKFGTFLRAERDKRTYGDIFASRSFAETIAWLKSGIGNTIVYEGMGSQFHDIAGKSGLIWDYLKGRSRLPFFDSSYDIAMHIRLGDFAPAQAGAAHQNTRIPLEWYRDALELAKRELGISRPKGILFSDADPAQLIDRLGLQGFVPEPPGNALTSIALLSRASALIGSRSSFSLWGRYFGTGIAIWPKGFELEKYAPLDATRDRFF